jgi:hypothetical protein
MSHLAAQRSFLDSHLHYYLGRVLGSYRSGGPCINESRLAHSQEMLNRGDQFGLSSGILIAIPSGVATALSTLGQNSSGMVGVAISLLLLPPAVNAGMCWAYVASLNAQSKY